MKNDNKNPRQHDVHHVTRKTFSNLYRKYTLLFNAHERKIAECASLQKTIKEKNYVIAKLLHEKNADEYDDSVIKECFSKAASLVKAKHDIKNRIKKLEAENIRLRKGIERLKLKAQK